MSKKRQYTKEAIDKAVNFVQNKEGSVRSAAKLFGVPRSTIQFKIKHPETKFKSGSNPVLTQVKESAIVNLILTLARRGFPRKKDDIQTCVQDYLKENPKPNPCRNNRPGDVWFNAFLKRHPGISVWLSEDVTNASACVSKGDLRKWFHVVRNYFDEEQLNEVVQDPRRIFNGDETGFSICPKPRNVFTQKGSKNVYEIEKASPKENITVVFSFSAAGFACKPMIIYPNEFQTVLLKVYRMIVGRSDNGWMTAAVFYEYTTNVFYPQIIANEVMASN